MAEITTPAAAQKKTLTPKQKKKSVRVDLTPMVDLGFLLITFFMFATTLAQRRGMKLVMPKECTGADCPTNVPMEKGLVLILGNNNFIYSYEAADPVNTFKVNNFGTIAPFRKMIADKKAKAAKEIPGDPKLVISIKSTEEATYGNFVNIMDEMQINKAGIAIVDKVNDEEKQMIAKTVL